MELLVRQVSRQRDRLPKDFSYHLKKFGWHIVDTSHIDRYEHLFKGEPLLLADMLASQMSGLYDAEVFDKTSVLESAFECTLDMLRDKGFERRLGEASEALSYESENIIIIAGSQNPRQTYRRVDAAVDYALDVLRAGLHITVCFSGQYPRNRISVSMFEAEEMRERFEDGLGQSRLSAQKRKNLYTAILEDQSASTIENVENSLKAVSEYISKPCTLALVSSSYHIPRYLAEFETKIQEGHAQNQIRSLVLIGAEGFSAKGIKVETHAFKSRFFKLLIFEIYRYFIETGKLSDYIREIRSHRKT